MLVETFSGYKFYNLKIYKIIFFQGYQNSKKIRQVDIFIVFRKAATKFTKHSTDAKPAKPTC